MSRTYWVGYLATVLTIVLWGFTPVMASDAWTGKYSGRKGSYHWHATISNRSAGVYALHVSVASQLPLCSGDLDTTARSMGDQLLVNDADCSLAITKRGAAGIKIEEKDCTTWHGAACLFESELSRN